ncbi:MAG: hypothetical protein QF829_00790, partial [Candidatus Hydrothermarchaeota archaeon]|nr:hypothetical protein [Candidatus Hydrothermarchaeota archaeon]
MAVSSKFVYEMEDLRKEIDRLNRIIQYNRKIYEAKLKDEKRLAEEKKQEIKQYRRQLKEAQKDFSKLEKALPDTGKVGGLKKLIDQKSARIRKFEKKIEDLGKYKKKTKDYKEEVANLKKDLKKSEKARSSAQDELVDLQSSRKSAGDVEKVLGDMRADLEGKEKRLLENVSFLKAEQKRAKSLENELLGLREKNENMELEIKEKITALGDAQSKIVDTVELQEENHDLQKEIKSLHKSLSDSGEVGGLKRMLKEKDVRIQELNGKLDELTGYKDESEDLKNELKSIHVTLSQAKGELSSTQDELVDLQTLRISKGEVEKTLDGMRADLEGKEGRLLETLSFLKAEQKRAKALEDELLEMRERYDDMEREFKEKSHEYVTRGRDFQSMEKEL